jgi:hypothetical protein
MRRGTSARFWKNYEAQQLNLVQSCMSKTMATGIRVPAPSRPQQPAIATTPRCAYGAGDVRVLSLAASRPSILAPAPQE